jgi:hypothetical protein
MEIKQQITRLINNLPEVLLPEVLAFLKEMEKEAKEKEKMQEFLKEKTKNSKTERKKS